MRSLVLCALLSLVPAPRAGAYDCTGIFTGDFEKHYYPVVLADDGATVLWFDFGPNEAAEFELPYQADDSSNLTYRATISGNNPRSLFHQVERPGAGTYTITSQDAEPNDELASALLVALDFGQSGCLGYRCTPSDLDQHDVYRVGHDLARVGTCNSPGLHLYAHEDGQPNTVATFPPLGNGTVYPVYGPLELPRGEHQPAVARFFGL
ncbi:MAG: hypothetical protein P1P84_25020 [Deferrisomatales bacterium]|nr:hypothetical protein [Deferrisomatales bacterium]